MSLSSVIISLPVADRKTSFAFYGSAMGLTALGEPAEDGVPEPLQFALNDGVTLMLIPSGGFGWIIGDREVAPPGLSECVLNVRAESARGVDDLVERAQHAGADVVSRPAQQPWGYAGAFADPDGHVWMVTSGPFPS